LLKILISFLLEKGGPQDGKCSAYVKKFVCHKSNKPVFFPLLPGYTKKGCHIMLFKAFCDSFFY